MPLFATLVVTCVLTAKGAECDIATHDKYQQTSLPVCFVKLDRDRFKVAKALMERTNTDELLPGSHNCFQTVAHRDSVLKRVLAQFEKAGIVVNRINLEK